MQQRVNGPKDSLHNKKKRQYIDTIYFMLKLSGNFKIQFEVLSCTKSIWYGF